MHVCCVCWRNFPIYSSYTQYVFWIYRVSMFIQRNRLCTMTCSSSVLTLWILKTHNLCFWETNHVCQKYTEMFFNILSLYFYKLDTENMHTIHIVCWLSISPWHWINFATKSRVCLAFLSQTSVWEHYVKIKLFCSELRPFIQTLW